MGRPVKKSIINLVFIHPQTGGTRLITAQKGSRRYKCAANGNTVFRLVPTTSLNPNEAYMIATDNSGNEYFVIKLTRHRATLIQKTLNSGPYLFQNGQAAKWDPWHGTDPDSVYIENDN